MPNSVRTLDDAKRGKNYTDVGPLVFYHLLHNCQFYFQKALFLKSTQLLNVRCYCWFLVPHLCALFSLNSRVALLQLKKVLVIIENWNLINLKKIHLKEIVYD